MVIDLQSALRDSLQRATSHSKNVYGKNPLTYEEVLDLAHSRVLTLAATVKPSGTPHLSPSDLVEVDGKLYVGMDIVTARYRNLKQKPSIVVMIADGWKRQAILEGTVSFLDLKSDLGKKVLDAQKRKYGWVTDALASFIVSKVFTWKQK